MKTIGLLVRERIIEEIKEKAKDTNACFFVGFKKVDAFSVNVMRNNLLGTGAKMMVAKNSLFKKAFEDLGWGKLNGVLDSETGVVFAYDQDIVRSCKVIVDFSKDNENVVVKGGFLKDKLISVAEVDALAKLPSKEILLGMALSGLASPLTGFLSTLNQIVLKFLWVVEEIKKKKGQ